MTRTYLVLELVTGGTVLDRIIADDHFTERDAAAVTSDVLHAVQYLHSLGIVHRDLKPENLLYAWDDPRSPYHNTVKVADFGMSKLIDPGDAQSMHTMCGSPCFVAPEVLSENEQGYGPGVDVWSLGVVVYSMLCGFLPFYSDSKAELFRLIKTGKYDFPNEYWSGVSPAAKDVIRHMLEVDTNARYSTQQCLSHEWITGQIKTKTLKRTTSDLHKNAAKFLLIRKLPIFHDIGPACLQRVAAKLTPCTVPANTHIIRAGEEGESMFFVQAGMVAVVVGEERVDTLTTGDFFGEVALTVSKQRTADVVSLGDVSTQDNLVSEYDLLIAGCEQERAPGPSELLQLLRSDFEEILRDFPILRSRLATVGTNRVRRASCASALPQVSTTCQATASPRSESPSSLSSAPTRTSPAKSPPYSCAAGMIKWLLAFPKKA